MEGAYSRQGNYLGGWLSLFRSFQQNFKTFYILLKAGYKEVQVRLPQASELLSGVNIAVGLVDFILHLPDGQVKILGSHTYKNFFGLVKMNSGLVQPGYSLPKREAGKLNFFVPC